MNAVTPEQRATLLRVLDCGVESRNMTHETALMVLDIVDNRAARDTQIRLEERERIAQAIEAHPPSQHLNRPYVTRIVRGDA